MLESNSTKTIVALALTMLATCGGVLVLVFFSLSKERDALRATSEKVEVELQREGQKAAEIALISETKTDREKLASYFIADSEVVDVLQKIEAIGERAGAVVKVNSVTDEVATKKKAKKNDDNEDSEEKKDTPAESLLRLGISAEGEWIEVYSFLTLLELLPIAQSVERVSIEKTEKTEIKNDDTLPPWKGLFEIKVRKEKI